MLAAAARGHINVVSSLLAAGTEVNYCEQGGDTAFLVAIQHGQLQVAELLLQCGADVDKVCGITGCTSTPLHRMISLGYTNHVQYLLAKGASIESRDGQCRTPLLLAVEKHQTECVQILANHGADVNVVTNVFKMTPLILAAERGYCDIVKILLKHHALLDQRDMRGFTALHAAVLASVVKTAEMLLAAGADPNILDDDGMSALMFAVYRNRPQISRLLVQHNCDINIQTDLRFLAHLSEQPVRFSAIQLAIAFRRKETATILLEAGCCLKNIEEFLQLRLPYVTPDRTRSMLRCKHKVQSVDQVTVIPTSIINNSSVTNTHWKEDQAWALLLRQYTTIPPRMTNVARTAVRRNLPHVNFKQTLDELQLPRPLKDYITMNEF